MSWNCKAFVILGVSSKACGNTVFIAASSPPTLFFFFDISSLTDQKAQTLTFSTNVTSYGKESLST